MTKEAAAWLTEKPMQSIDLVRDNLKKSADRVLARVDDMRDPTVVFPTPNVRSTRALLLDHGHARIAPRGDRRGGDDQRAAEQRPRAGRFVVDQPRPQRAATSAAAACSRFSSC